MYSQLGDIVFNGVFSPETQESTSAVNYAQHARILGKPSLQRTGTELDQIKIGMHLHRLFTNPESVIDQLKAHMNDSTVLRYIDGTGKLIGNFVITSLKNNPTAHGPTGLIIDTVVEVDLLEAYQDSSETSAIQTAVNTGFANALTDPIVVVESVQPLTPIGIASNNVSGITAGTSAMQSDITTAQRDPSRAASALRAAADTARRSANAADEAITQINGTVGNVYARTRQLETALVQHLTSLSEFREACASGDVLAAADAMLAVAGSNNEISASAGVLAQLSASRIPLTNE